MPPCLRPYALILALIPLLHRAHALPETPASTPEDVLGTLERVADWQLAHPVSFDVFSHRPSEARWELTRVSWNGEILSRRPCNPRPEPQGLPEAWVQLLRLEKDDVSFNEMPAAAQAAWLRETDLPATAVKLVQMCDGSTRGWEMGTLYHGLLALSRHSTKPTYRTALAEVAKANAWRLGERIYHADDHTVGYLYLALHERNPAPEQLAGVQSRFEWILRHQPTHPLDIASGSERWTWCDALFMSPPVWARLARTTGDRVYLDYMDREWWATVDHLYVPEQKLFLRDSTFRAKREANDAPVFWSRGNGWVLAGLALVLQDMPEDYPARRRYVDLFSALAGRVAFLQQEDGLWRSSLLNPSAYPEPEVSSSALFCFALAWGINHGLLPSDPYRSRVLRTWGALTDRVAPDGRLGYVQLPSAQPGSATEYSTAPYGVGAFLLAGCEVYRLLLPGDKARR